MIVKNTFDIEVSASFPDGPEGYAVERWLMREWFGRAEIPISEKIPQDHPGVEAYCKMHRGRRFQLTVQVAKDGSWKLVSVDGRDVSYPDGHITPCPVESCAGFIGAKDVECMIVNVHNEE